MSDEFIQEVSNPILPTRLKFEGPKGPLFSAVAEARKSFKSLSTNAKVQFGEGQKARKHNYATLDAVIDALEPGWMKAGLTVIQPHDGDVLWTIVAFGESSMTVEQPLTGWKSAQDLAGLLTYFRRYALKGIFCVADDEDDDGSSLPGGQGKPLGRNEPAVAPKAAPVSEAKQSVVDKAKELGLSSVEFGAMVKEHTQKLWKDCGDDDAKKLLAVLEAKSVFGKDGAK